MNPMTYPQSYPAGQGTTFNQVIRRPLTDAERQLTSGIYRTFQKGLRGISAVCLILFVFNGYVLPGTISDQITYDSISMMLIVFMAVMGAVSIGMSVNAIVIRKRISDAMMDGTAIEVIGPAYRTSGMRKGQSWGVGPISMLPTRGLERLIQEGMQTSVLCLPRMKAAIAVNNCGLKQGVRIMFPPNLEAMAVPMGAVPMQQGGQTPAAAYPVYGTAMPQAQAPQAPRYEDPPPPPPD